MANQKQLNILKQDVDSWNEWRKENPDVLPVLSDAELRGAKLKGANLGGVNLILAKLREVDFGSADLTNTDLTGAELRNANLSGAKLRGAKLGGAKLNGADLRDADLTGADLGGANLIEAELSGANFRDADLRDAVLNKVNFSMTNISGAQFSIAGLRDADLGEAKISMTIISDADLRKARLRDAIGEVSEAGVQSTIQTAQLSPIVADDWYVNEEGQLSLRPVGIAQVDDEFRRRLEVVESELANLREQLRGQNNPDFIDPAAFQSLQEELGEANREIKLLNNRLAERPDGPIPVQMPHTRTAGMSLNRIAELAAGTALGIAGGSALIKLIAKVAGGLQWLTELIQTLPL